MTYQKAVRALRAHADPKKALVYRGYFKNSQNDIVLGVTAPQLRAIAGELRGLSFSNLRKLMRSRVHDERSLAHAILVLEELDALQVAALFYKWQLCSRLAA